MTSNKTVRKYAAALAAALAAPLALAIPAMAQEQAIIVLDASGSMWGQIGGTPKIVIAREVLDKVVGTVLATRPLNVMAVAVTIDAPAEIAAGELLTVVWAGPGAARDAVEIFDPAANKVAASKRLANDDYKNRKASMKAPKAPGAYLLRYWSGDGRTSLAERPLTVR